MLMRRAKTWRNLLSGICIATFAIIWFCQILRGHPASLLFLGSSLYFLWRGFSQIHYMTQSLEVTDSEIIYQTAWKITRVPWSKITAYILFGERFVALDKQRHQILLDLDLRSDHETHWPIQECAQVKSWIRRKMNESGAVKESVVALQYDYKQRIKT